MKFWLATLWTLAIAVWFYIQQPYYGLALSEWPFLVFFFAVVALGAFLFSLTLHRKKSISLWWTLPLGVVFAMVFGLFRFFQFNFAKLQRFTIAKEGNDVVFYESFVPENAEIIFQKGDIVMKSHFIRQSLPSEVATFFDPAGVDSLLHLFGIILLVTGLALLLFAIFVTVGSILNKRPLIATGLGMLLFSLLAFLLTSLGVFTPVVFGVASALIFFVSIPFAGDTWRSLVKWRLNLSEHRTARLVLLSVSVALLGLALIDAIRVIPVGWDDLNTYARNARLLAEFQIFPHNVGFFAWTNLTSVFWLFVDTFQGSSSLSLLVVVLGFLAFTSLLKRFSSLETSWLVALVFFTLPFLVFQQIMDQKTDLPLLFIGLLSIDQFFEWGGKKGKKDLKPLLILALLLGFAVAIKISGLLLAIILVIAVIGWMQKTWQWPLGLGLIVIAILGFAGFYPILNPTLFFWISVVLGGLGLAFSIWGLSRNLRHDFLKLGLFLLAVIMTVLPWGIYNILDSPSISLTTAIYGQSYNIRLIEVGEYCDIENEVVELDYSRYTGGEVETLGSFALFPWRINFTPGFDHPVADFSFLFLGALSFFALFPKKTLIKNKTIGGIAMMTALYFVLWLFIGRGVIWYGLFWLVGAMILIAHLFKVFDRPKTHVLTGILLLVLVSNLILRLDQFAQPQLFANALGMVNKDETRDYIFPGYAEVAALLSPAEEVRLYRVGTFIPYFLNLKDEQIANDHFFDHWRCIQDADEKIIKDSFNSKGITHILVHENPAANLGDDTFRKYHNSLREFLARSGWKKLYQDHGLLLYEVTSP